MTPIYLIGFSAAILNAGSAQRSERLRQQLCQQLPGKLIHSNHIPDDCFHHCRLSQTWLRNCSLPLLVASQSSLPDELWQQKCRAKWRTSEPHKRWNQPTTSLSVGDANDVIAGF